MNQAAQPNYGSGVATTNPFTAEDGNPFDDIPDVEDYNRKREFVGTPDYSDGGTYEDDFGPDPYLDEPAQSQPQQQTPSQIMPQEDRFPGEDIGFDQVDVEVGGTASVNAPEEDEEDKKTYRMWNIAYYRGYFNVDSKEVGTRILRSFLPYSTGFFENIKTNPDLYGPFWIATTLIFVMAASANFASWLADADNFQYDFKTVTFGAAAIYGYILVVPIALWIAFRWLAVSLGLVQIVCFYGYSLFVFLPIAVLCILPFDWLRWALIGAAVADSIVFLVMNLFPPLVKNNLEESKKVLGGVIVIAIVALLHVGLGLTFKFYFFHYTDIQK